MDEPEIFTTPQKDGQALPRSAIAFRGILRDIHEKNKADLEEDEESGSGKAKLYSVEIDPLIATVTTNLISLAGLHDIVEVIHFYDEGVLVETDIDLLLIDHDEAFYELDKLGFLIKDGALVIAVNGVRPGAAQYRNYMRMSSRLCKSWGLPGLIVGVSCLTYDRLELRL
ncbi:O-methyltransferase family 3 [Penicillium mononematosum]|uniref:O-methyltransferase family 3 n=1 Tax=Penicillium mononematosum TaxID=268346 RepID=UPI002546FD69|nr:O-methyltransferase family 3 [Penicillium mononematosum]KAJ6181207.1 O-methyltransferase family 3 [Penicillium mononematosum]